MSELTHSDEELALIELAQRVLPAGSFGNLPGDIVIREGRGGRVWDVSGNEYVDFLLGSGPMFIGHCHPDVMAAVQAQIPRGTTFFANNEHGIRLAEAIVDAVACAEKVRFVSSGTEADAYAMRVARAFRGRDKILKFEGGYHGMSDYSLMSLAPKRPGNFPQAVPDFAGIPRSVRDEMIIAPFNDPAMAVSLIHEHHDELGGVIVEPFQRLLPPKPGFLQALRDADRGARHSADLRRGGDRVPLRLWRGAGVLRRDARPLHAGQDHRRRLPAGGDRRARGHHGAVRPRQGRRRRGS